MTKYLKVYDWNPNGTNDCEVIQNGEVVDSLCEAFFGINTGTKQHIRISIKDGLKRIAISPCENGNTTVNFLKKHFKSIK